MYALFFTMILFFLLLFTMHLTNNEEDLIEAFDEPERQSQNWLGRGPSYQNYNNSDPMILAQKNAANIEYLKSRLNELKSLEQNFVSLKTDVADNKKHIEQMAKMATKHLVQRTGLPTKHTPPAIKGLKSISDNPANQISKN